MRGDRLSGRLCRATNDTGGPAFDQEPTWSPDGTAVAFKRGQLNVRQGRDDALIMVARIADGAPTPLWEDSPGAQTGAAWSRR